MENGTIFKIQRFCTEDGPGIRTTVFLKGCPLKCLWCHNPESQLVKPQLVFNEGLCIGCRKCFFSCKNGCHVFKDNKHFINRQKCDTCGECLSPSCKALSVSGYTTSTDEIIKEVMKDKIFYDSSGGGLTLSGGEPLFQPEFTLELLKKAKETGIGTCIETCAFADNNVIRRILPYTDLFLLDFKEADSTKHKQYTGVGNEIILENIRTIDENSGGIILRCPMIPDYNDNYEHLKGIANLANSLKNVKEINIEPYHSFGENKYSHLGRDYGLQHIKPPDTETKNEWTVELQQLTRVKVKCL